MLLPFLLMESKSAQKSRKKISSQASFAGRDAGYKKGKNKIIAIARAGSKELKSEAIWILAT